MILSKKYKEELDKIVMNEEMKKRILHNVLNGNIEDKNIKPQMRKHTLLRRNMQIVAACFTVVICLSVVKSYPQLFKHENENLQKEEISKDIDDKNKDLQNIEESESDDNNKDTKTYNRDSKDDNDLKEHPIINQYTSDNEKYKESESTKHNKNNNLNDNENSSKIEPEAKSSGNLASDSSTSPKSELPANANVEQINTVGSDNIQKDTTKKQDGVTVNNSNENEQENSQLSSCGYFIKEYKTLEKAESAAKLKINPVKALPKGFNMDNICVISNQIIQITYINNRQDTITFRAGKDIDNISGDYNIYEVKNVYKINGIDANLEGNKNKVVKLVNWKKDNISYSISSTNGIDEEVVLNMIKSSL